MGKYVTIDNATYFSTPQANLVDGDTANLHESIGDWANAGGGSVPALSSDLTPVFGTSTGKQLKIGASSECSIRTQTGLNGFPVSASTQYTFVYSSGADVASREARPLILWYDDAGASTGNSVGTKQAVPNGSLGAVTYTVSSPALTAFAALQSTMFVVGGGNLADGEAYYWDAVSIHTGAGTTFYPSLDVATPTYTKDPAGATAAVPSGMTVGIGWAGDVVKVELLDGVEGPVVAVVNANDPATVGNGDTWLDDTGRTWTVNGAGASIGYAERNPNKMATPGQLLRTGG